jgi:hypothetical protein
LFQEHFYLDTSNSYSLPNILSLEIMGLGKTVKGAEQKQQEKHSCVLPGWKGKVLFVLDYNSETGIHQQIPGVDIPWDR